MMTDATSDIAIVGGGLAGLSLAIMQAKEGKSVALFEKNTYPFHRVCGEYISLESWEFLESLGLPLSTMQLPIIKKLQVTSPKGSSIETDLDLGGFGISRYILDYELAKLAEANGVKLYQNTKVNAINNMGEGFQIVADNQEYKSKLALGSFGKRSNLDIEWKRPFIYKNRTSLNQYIGVKYHIKTDFPKDKIALHNFDNGYCGISAIEDDLYCMCYMTTKSNLKKCNNNIAQMEEKVLSKNPFLSRLFANSERVWAQPEVISQISFEKKSQFFNEIPLVGDASGMIAPLCGNGMSMAFHGSLLIHNIIQSQRDINKFYPELWNKTFSTRLKVGRAVQSLFGNPFLTEVLIQFMKRTPWILNQVIKSTHGQNIGKFQIK